MRMLRSSSFLVLLPVLAFAACGVPAPPDLAAFTDFAAMGKVDEVRAGLAAHPEWAKAQLPGSGRTALHCAALLGRVEVAQVLCDAGADLAAVSADEQATALHTAAERGQDDFAAFLLTRKPPLEARDRFGRTPLAAACWGAGPYQYLVRILLEAGAQLEAADANGFTPLMLAAVHGNPDVLGVLLQRGAKVDVVAADGRTALSVARDGGHAEAVTLLDQAGAKK